MPKWTPQQEALFDAAINNTENILVQGVAGCAKSTSGKESVKRIKNGKIGWIAYNNHIVAEIKPKLEQYASVSTLHALGRSLIGKMFPSVGEPDEAKAKKILESMKPQWFYPKRSGGTGARDAAEACLKLAKLCKYTLSDESDFSALEELVDHFGIEMPSYGASEDEIFEHVSKVIERGLEDTSSIDFDDMIFWPVRKNMNIDKFDTLFIDELQDFNLCQQTLARKAGNRLIGLGDSRQCQPAGTMITQAVGGTRWNKGDCSKIPIESLKSGDYIASWDRRSAIFVAKARVNAVKSRSYEGNLFIISTENHCTRVTPNHRWVVRWSTRETDIWCVYLMRRTRETTIGKVEDYRLGWCQLFSKGGGFHLGHRTRLELADCAWIISIHNSKPAASIQESFLSVKFGIPLIIFDPDENTLYNNEWITKFWDRVQGSINIKENASKLLNHYGRDIRYPLYKVEGKQRQGRTTLFTTETCNLIPDLMALPSIPKIMSSETPAEWFPIRICQYEKFKGDVYSLDVDKHHKYIADGLVTCNSLYSWAGADTESMGRFKTALDQTDRHCIEKPLTVTFRCPVSHVQIAKRIVSYIEPAENAIEGIIRQIHPTEAGFELMPGDLAICRCNAPLVSLAYSMITSGIPTLMRGRDIGQGLTGLIARLKPDNPEDLARKLADYERKELDRLDRRNGSDQQKQSIQDRVQCLESLCSQMPNIAELTRFIQELFTEDGGNGKVVLSSVHRAKGLEANRVVIVAPEKLFMLRKNARDWERTEAANIAYVSITRAKQELIFAGDIPAIFQGVNNGNQTDIGNTPRQTEMFKV